MTIQDIDAGLIRFFQRIWIPLARFGIFIIFFWFGALKVVGLSPASGVVERLFNETVPFITFASFLIAFGLFECAIGILFLVRGAERIALPLLIVHMITTTGPLVLLPQETWSAFLVPTLEGQYIIKNLAIIAAAVGIAANLEATV